MCCHSPLFILKNNMCVCRLCVATDLPSHQRAVCVLPLSSLHTKEHVCCVCVVTDLPSHQTDVCVCCGCVATVLPSHQRIVCVRVREECVLPLTSLPTTELCVLWVCCNCPPFPPKSSVGVVCIATILLSYQIALCQCVCFATVLSSHQRATCECVCVLCVRCHCPPFTPKSWVCVVCVLPLSSLHTKKLCVCVLRVCYH